MARKKNKTDSTPLDLEPLLILGMALIVLALVLSMLISSFPMVVRNIMYFVGVLALVVYMFLSRQQKRAGKK